MRVSVFGVKKLKKTIEATTTVMLALVFVVPYILLTVPAMVSASGNWQGEYWNLSEEEHVSDLVPNRTADFTRQDAEINFYWEDQAPDASISADYFAVRWTKSMYFEAGSYDFETSWDNKMRITVDGETVLDGWDYDGGSNDIYTASTAGNKQVVVEFKEVTGWATAYLDITPLTTPPEAIELIGQTDFNSSIPNTFNPTNYGFESPEGLAVDTVNHRLFVADYGEYAHRVLVFNLNSNNELVDKTADYVLGQSSMTERADSDCTDSDYPATANTLCEPRGMDVDEVNNRLFVADADNNRVMVYDLDNIASGMAASRVLGQANFNSIQSNRGTDAASNGLDYPTDVSYDHVDGRLFVSDESNSRVLVYDVLPNEISNGMSATAVLGQGDFTGDCSDRCSNTAANTLDNPMGIHFDEASARLLVADSDNNRALIYNLNDGLTDGEDAETVLGQADFTEEYEDRDDAAGINTLDDPNGIHYDPDKDMIFIADQDNARVVVYDDNGDGLGDISDGANFSYVLGQADFTGYYDDRDDVVGDNTFDEPAAVLTIPGTDRLLVSDDDNRRVVLYDIESLTDGESAVDVLGQANLSSSLRYGINRISSSGLNTPSDVELDTKNNRIFVPDTYNGRVLIYNTNSDGSLIDSVADGVIGQSNFTDYINDDENGCPDATASNLCTPRSAVYDETNERLFVADDEYHRITVYNVEPNSFENGPEATHVLGQSSMTGSEYNQGGSASNQTLYDPKGLALDADSNMLYVADEENNRVLGYNVSTGTIADGMEADRIIGQADHVSTDCNRADNPAVNTLCYPYDVAIDQSGDKLYIADNSNSRVVLHAIGEDFEDGQDAVALIGQSDFDESSCGDTSVSALCYPTGVAIDAVNSYVYISDQDNNRVVRYALSDSYGSAQAGLVYGQYSEAMNDCNVNYGEPTQYSLCEPWGLTINQETGQLWVADKYNNRVLGYGDPVEQQDQDDDGISDEIENAGPNNGDANNDGIPDSQQANVSSMANPVSGNYAVLAVNDDCSIKSLEIIAEADVSNVNDSGFDYPVGLMDFRIDCGDPGFTATIQQYYYGATGSFTVRKYIPSTGAYTNIPGSNTEATTIAEQSVTIAAYQLTDGSDYDLDGEENGSIEDPAGLAQSTVGSPNTGLR